MVGQTLTAYYVATSKRAEEFLGEDKLFDCQECARDCAAFIHDYFDELYECSIYTVDGEPSERCHNKEHQEKHETR